jgi:hypothetical protein
MTRKARPPDPAFDILRLALSGFPATKAAISFKGLPLDAFGQLRPLAEFNLLQKRNGNPRGDHAIPQLPLQRL